MSAGALEGLDDAGDIEGPFEGLDEVCDTKGAVEGPV
jgi:hypothetical protein